MIAGLLVLLLVTFGTCAWGQGPERTGAPSYSAETVVNWTTGRQGPFAPNVVVSVYGTDLAYGEEAANWDNVKNNLLPDQLANVQVLVMRGSLGIPIALYYVGPRQINALLPASLDPGDVELRVVREGAAGPAVRITLDETAPALLQEEDGTTIRATHADWSLITNDNPARPGEIIVLFATGLGRVALKLDDREIPPIQYLDLAALTILAINDLRVYVGEKPVDADRIYYAGLVPGTAGIYQINVKLPDPLPSPDPYIVLLLRGNVSPFLRLPAKMESNVQPSP
jgi:uncharacterized protein (TIGR03437 family)